MKSTSSLTNAAIDTTDPLSAARLESDKKCKSMDLLKVLDIPLSLRIQISGTQLFKSRSHYLPRIKICFENTMFKGFKMNSPIQECSKPTSDKLASKGECTFYENTDKMSDLSLDDPPSTLSLGSVGSAGTSAGLMGP